jgi:hypothetical protein
MRPRAALWLLTAGTLVVFCGGALANYARTISTHKQTANEWFVSSDGSASNNGTIDSPWNLRTALDHPPEVIPGDTIWIRGGIYEGHFKSRLIGTIGARITVRGFPGERATIADDRPKGGATLEIWGSSTDYRDLEITNTNPNRRFQGLQIYRPIGVHVQGDHVRLINLVVHDVGIGIGFWRGAIDSEIYGSLIYNNGNLNTLNKITHGHGIYTQNNRGTKTIRDNLIFDNSGIGIQVYPNPGQIAGYDIVGNVLFENGILNDGTTRLPNFLVCGYAEYVPERISLTGNMTYMSSAQETTGRFRDAGAAVGYCGDSTPNVDVELEDNLFVGGQPALNVSDWKRVTAHQNTVVSWRQVVALEVPPRPHTETWNDNAYFNDGQSKSFWFQGSTMGFSRWKRVTGLDATSSYTPARPEEATVMVRPNVYDDSRATIVVYNWDEAPTVGVDVGSVLQVGDSFEVRNVQDYFGEPILSGIYQGEPLPLPMTGMGAVQPVGSGFGSAAEPTGPLFNAFVLVKT